MPPQTAHTTETGDRANGLLLSLFRSGRPLESLLMCGFPALGVFLAGVDDALDAVIYLALVWLTSMAVFSFNAWGGAQGDSANPRLAHEPLQRADVAGGSVALYSLVLLAFALFGLSQFGPRSALLAIGIFVVWTLYSHPRIHWKAVPILSSAVHLVGGVLMFALGYSWQGRWDLPGWAAAVFLALTFAAGHLNHQVMDHDADARAGLSTTAVRFGARPVFYAGFGGFALAYAALAASFVAGAADARLAGPFLLIALPHAAWFARFAKRDPVEAAATYQQGYRILYLLAGAAVIAMHLI